MLNAGLQAGSIRSYDVRTEESGVVVLRQLICLYFILLLIEGALRKWFLPSLTAPLLVIRDPVVLLIYLQAVRCRRFPVHGPMCAFFVLLVAFILLGVFQIFAGIGGGVMVAAYGLRTNFLHLPLIFVIPEVFTYSDVVKLGKWTLIISVPMAALMFWQFMSPADSWINAASTSDAQQIAFAMGKIRPAGTFTFITGAAHFFVLVTAFLIYGLVEQTRKYTRWLLGAALVGELSVLPASGSRTLVLGCVLIAAGAVLYTALSRAGATRILAAAGLICAVFFALSLTGFFRDALEVFTVRITDNGGEALGPRILESFLDPLALSMQAGLLGKGLGLGTNAAAAWLTGAGQFLLAETEWSRVVLEAGPLLGFSFLAYRAWIAGDIALRAMTAARRQNLLAWLLAWDACISLVYEQISQPTNLGFMVFVSGLCLAAMPERSLAASFRKVMKNSPMASGTPLPQQQFS